MAQWRPQRKLRWKFYALDIYPFIAGVVCFVTAWKLFFLKLEPVSACIMVGGFLIGGIAMFACIFNHLRKR